MIRGHEQVRTSWPLFGFHPVLAKTRLHYVIDSFFLRWRESMGLSWSLSSKPHVVRLRSEAASTVQSSAVRKDEAVKCCVPHSRDTAVGIALLLPSRLRVVNSTAIPSAVPTAATLFRRGAWRVSFSSCRHPGWSADADNVVATMCLTRRIQPVSPP